MTSLLYHFWGHPIRRSSELIAGLVRGRNFKRGTEIRQLAGPIIIDEDIRTLEISVNNPLRVKVRKPLENLKGVDLNELFIQCSELREHVLE